MSYSQARFPAMCGEEGEEGEEGEVEEVFNLLPRCECENEGGD
jgi:hypothetical protein